MCESEHPDAGTFMANLRLPMPLHRKIWLVLRNLTRRVTHLQDCCDHPGEPGC